MAPPTLPSYQVRRSPIIQHRQRPREFDTAPMPFARHPSLTRPALRQCRPGSVPPSPHGHPGGRRQWKRSRALRSGRSVPNARGTPSPSLSCTKCAQQAAPPTGRPAVAVGPGAHDP
eukprot:534858-Prorocentrum_minimum.AAC.1